jgi:hypothetical protein
MPTQTEIKINRKTRMKNGNMGSVRNKHLEENILAKFESQLKYTTVYCTVLYCISQCVQCIRTQYNTTHIAQSNTLQTAK